LNLFWARMRNRWLKIRFKGKALHPLAQKNLTALDHLMGSNRARSFRYVVVDLETTGLNFTDHVLSVGAFGIVEGRIRLSETFFELIKPTRDITLSSIKIHGIAPDMVAQARPAWEVFDDFLGFLGVDILVAHNASFDRYFLNKAMQRRYGIPLQNLFIDTLRLCKGIRFLRNPYNFGMRFKSEPCSLDALAKQCGIEIHQRHTALGDALATAMIFQRMLVRLEETGPGMLSDLVRLGALS
jgi:DNA polymerase-3 subunit epsilon